MSLSRLSSDLFVSARRKLLSLDGALSLCGLAFGATSLSYPFGRDQGIYAYIGREWLAGRLPYKSSFDVKTPGIFAIHALSIALFGDRQWGMRLLELVCVLVLGLLSASLVVPRAGRILPGTRGSAVFAASIFYYGFFNFWDTGQCELWCITFAFGALVAVRGMGTVDVAATPSDLRRAAVAGLLAGLSLFCKPPAMWFVAVIVFFLVRRGWATGLPIRHRVTRTLALLAVFGAGPVLLLLLVLWHFWAHGALADLYDVLVVNNRYYVIQGRWVNSTHDVLLRLVGAFNAYNPGAILLVDGLVIGGFVAFRRRDHATLRVHLLVFTLLACATAAVTMQLKFCFYHWGLIVGPAAAAIAVLTADLQTLLGDRARPWLPAVATAAGLAVTFALCGEPARRWWFDGASALSLLSGRIDRETFLRRFDLLPPMPFSAGDTAEIAAWVKAHSTPEDTIAVRGFEPQIYLLSQRHFPGRFFWTTFLVTPKWSYRLDDWVEEDRQVFVKTPPRYVLALSFVHSGVDSAEYFLPLGYQRVAEVHAYVILERTARTAAR